MNYCCAKGDCELCRAYFARTGKVSSGIISYTSFPEYRPGEQAVRLLIRALKVFR